MFAWLKNLSPRLWLAMACLALGITISYYGYLEKMALLIMQDQTCDNDYRASYEKLQRLPERIVSEQKRLNAEHIACLSMGKWEFAMDPVERLRRGK